MSTGQGIVALVVLVYLLQLVAVFFVVVRKQSAHAAVAWVLALLTLPGLGLLAFAGFGRRRLPRRLLEKEEHRQRFDAALGHRGLLHTGEDVPPWPGPISRVACQLGCPPPREGNRVISLNSGQAAFVAIHDAIAEARHHVHVEEYIFKHTGLGGKLLDLLVEKARAGVEVRVLVDAVGTTATRHILKQIRQAGGKAEVFLPLFPFGLTMTVNWRTHRKIIVCDGKVGFIGGMNVGDEYFGRLWRNRSWTDAHVRIEGPAVWDLQRLFASDWDFAHKELLGQDIYFPPLPPEADPGEETMPEPGLDRVQVVPGGPDQPINAIREVLIAALAGAKESIRIASPYMVPEPTIRDLLANAALRGVRVELITQGAPPEYWVTFYGSRFYWEALLEAGVRIYTYSRGILHTKLYLVDDGWAAVGSVNLDARSFGVNFEVLGLLDTPAAVDRIRERYEMDLHHAEPVELETFRRRHRRHRAFEGLARLLSPLL